MTLYEMIFGRRFTLKSPLSPDECARRLAKELDHSWSWFGLKPFQGTATARQIYIRCRSVFFYDFQTAIYADLEIEDGGTRFNCKTGTMRSTHFVAVLYFIALTFYLFSLLPHFIEPVSQSVAPHEEKILLFLFVLAPLALFVWGRFLAKRDEEILVEFLENEIGARRVYHRATPAK